MLIQEGADPSEECQDVDDALLPGEKAEEAIFTCKFPGCSRQYASTDGVRKHCRKMHMEWLRQVDQDKANLGCRWAAYCTREAITEGHDPRTTPVGSKRAREIMAQGGLLPPMSMPVSEVIKSSDVKSFSSNDGAPISRPASFGGAADGERTAGSNMANNMANPVERIVQKPRHAPHGLAPDGKSALVPLKPLPKAAMENMMPPEMIALPGELHSALPTNVSALTPNAHARQRLGEIADSESICLQGGTVAALPPSPLCEPPPPLGANSFFVQWGMPPVKRGQSLADARVDSCSHLSSMLREREPSYADDLASLSHDSPSGFADSVLA